MTSSSTSCIIIDKLINISGCLTIHYCELAQFTSSFEKKLFKKKIGAYMYSLSMKDQLKHENYEITINLKISLGYDIGWSREQIL